METIISVRVEKKLHEQMKTHHEINWSAVLRKSITERLESKELDKEKAQAALRDIRRLRRSKMFNFGKSSPGMLTC